MAEMSQGKSSRDDAPPLSQPMRLNESQLRSDFYYETPPMFLVQTSNVPTPGPISSSHQNQTVSSASVHNSMDVERNSPAAAPGNERCNGVGQLSASDSRFEGANASQGSMHHRQHSTVGHQHSHIGSEVNARPSAPVGTTHRHFEPTFPSAPARMLSSNDFLPSPAIANTPNPLSAPPGLTQFSGRPSNEALKSYSTGVPNTARLPLNPTAIRNPSLPDLNLSTARGTDLRRLAKYKDFGLPTQHLARTLYPIDAEHFKYQLHTHFKIKTVATIKCGVCREKCPGGRSGEVYQCTACTSQICRDCVEKKLRKEGEQGRLDDPNRSAPYKFEWDGEIKHEGFKLCYLQRKLNQGDTGDYEIQIPLKYLLTQGQIHAGEENRLVVIRMFKDTAGSTRKRKTRENDEEEANQPSGRSKRNTGFMGDRNISAANAGTREEPIDLEKAEKQLQQEEEQSERVVKQSMGIRAFEKLQKIRDHAKNGTRPPVVAKPPSPPKGRPVLVEGQGFNPREDRFAAWPQPQQQANHLFRYDPAQAAYQPRMMAQKSTRQRPQPIDVMAANQQQAAYMSGIPHMPYAGMTTWQLQQYQQFQLRQHLRTQEFLQHLYAQSPFHTAFNGYQALTGPTEATRNAPYHDCANNTPSQRGQGEQLSRNIPSNAADAQNDGELAPSNVVKKASSNGHLSNPTMADQVRAEAAHSGGASHVRPIENTAGLPRYLGPLTDGSRRPLVSSSGLSSQSMEGLQTPQTDRNARNSKTSPEDKWNALVLVANMKAAEVADDHGAPNTSLNGRHHPRNLTNPDILKIEEQGLHQTSRTAREDDDTATIVLDAVSTESAVQAQGESTAQNASTSTTPSDNDLQTAAHTINANTPKSSDPAQTDNGPTIDHNEGVGDGEQDFGLLANDSGSVSGSCSDSSSASSEDGDDSGVFDPKTKTTTHRSVTTRRTSSAGNSNGSKSKGKVRSRGKTSALTTGPEPNSATEPATNAVLVPTINTEAVVIPSQTAVTARVVKKNVPLRFVAGVPDFAAIRPGRGKAKPMMKRQKTEEELMHAAALLTGEKKRLVDYGSSGDDDDDDVEEGEVVEAKERKDVKAQNPKHGTSRGSEEASGSDYEDEDYEMDDDSDSMKPDRKGKAKALAVDNNSGFVTGRDAKKAWIITANKNNKAIVTPTAKKTKQSPMSTRGRLRSGKEFMGVGREQMHCSDSDNDSSDEDDVSIICN